MFVLVLGVRHSPCCLPQLSLLICRGCVVVYREIEEAREDEEKQADSIHGGVRREKVCVANCSAQPVEA